MGYTCFYTEEEEKICDDFFLRTGEDNVTHYSNEHQQEDPTKVKSDILIGKYAEFAVHRFFREEFDLETEPPDISKHEVWDSDKPGKKKSFDPDLPGKFNGKNFFLHVKSCREISSFPHSWVMNQKDKVIRLPRKEDFFICCTVLPQKRRVEIVAAPNAFEVWNMGLWRTPLSKTQKQTKTCLYLSDLANTDLTHTVSRWRFFHHVLLTEQPL